MDGSLQAWRGRQVARTTRSLSREAAGWVDTQIAPFADKIGFGRVIALVEAAIMRFDPEEADRKAKAAADGRRVWVGEEITNGTRSIVIEADAMDAEAFDRTIDQIAGALGQLGDQDRAEVRRAKAVGQIADPQGTLDLLDTADRIADGPADEASNRGAGDRTAHRGSGNRRSRSISTCTRRRCAVAGASVAPSAWAPRPSRRSTPGSAGPTSRSPRCWTSPTAAAWTRTSNNLSRNKDMDHIAEFVPPDEGGPPGQTAAHKLGSPCRRHHRLKTHGGWSYAMPEPGIYLWRSPLGRRYLVDHTGTTPLPHPA